MKKWDIKSVLLGLAIGIIGSGIFIGIIAFSNNAIWQGIFAPKSNLQAFPDHFTSGGSADITQSGNAYTFEGVIKSEQYHSDNLFKVNPNQTLVARLNSLEYVSGEEMEEDSLILSVTMSKDKMDNSGLIQFGLRPDIMEEDGIALSMSTSSLEISKETDIYLTINNVSGKDLIYSFTITLEDMP